ncbi:hypothetical protein C6P40_001519 [Pichia californica]|uniref:Threonyl/alanyl tRNA synthetase SAD domain-containing protein n=1 Tax=Pichia californica TaxID=460514 RepID=A0A9P7BFE6_9ASCO|nr:hypothetical protein C6P40_001519 [[Candida] californica]
MNSRGGTIVGANKDSETKDDVEAIIKPLYEIELEDTVLFPEGGGQPADRGFLMVDEKKIEVLDVQRKNLRAVHIVNEPIPENSQVDVEISWRRRLDHMQQHTGQHLLSAILDKWGLPTLSWNMGEKINYVEIPRKLEKDELDKVSEEVNDEIFNNTKIDIVKPEIISDNNKEGDNNVNDEKGILRVVKIGKLDENPCCGTHLSSVGQIKAISLLGQIKGKGGNNRLNFICGDRVYKYTGELYDMSKKLMNTMSSSFEELDDKADGLVKQVKKLQHREKTLLKELAISKAEELIRHTATITCVDSDISKSTVYLYREDDSLEFLSSVAAALVLPERTMAVLLGGRDDSVIVMGGPSTSIETVVEQLKSCNNKLKPVGSAESVLANVISNNANALNNFSLETEEKLDEYFDVPLEEFLYHAELQRELEKSPDYGKAAPTIPLWEVIRTKLLNKPSSTEPESTVSSLQISNSAEKEKGNTSESYNDLVNEPLYTSRENANRMIRVASWGSVFYLITTDILGPTSAPYAIAELGYVPGALLYFLFGITAAYCGVLLWNQFLKLDSIKYPLRNYGDVVGRIYGRNTRYAIDFFQSVQLFCNVAVIILGNGQGLSQIAKGKGCYTILIFVWGVAGAIVGQIKSLAKFGFLANAAIWMNVFVIIATMACAAAFLPNYTAAFGTSGVTEGPVITKVVVSGAGSEAFQNQLNACMNIVYSYGGALVFIEFMAEMKRPWDFWKGMACAQLFIFSLYLLFAMVVYHYQGQFVINPANQGISNYGWQTTTNVINLVSALIAAGLYGNVGIKCLYSSIFERFFKWPSLNSKFGRWIWTVFVCVYWAIAFVFAAAIPNFSSLVSLIGAVCILQFSYTFPFIMQFGFDIQLGALVGDGEYDHINKITHRIDTWRNWSRWSRGFKQKWFSNTCHLILFLASAATAALGIYASSMSLKAAFQSGSTTSFTCKSPVA